MTRDAGAGQELAQEAFARARERWGAMESEAHASNFVYAVAMNVARSHLRNHARVRPLRPCAARAHRERRSGRRLRRRLEMVERFENCPRGSARVVLVDDVEMDTASVAGCSGSRRQPSACT